MENACSGITESDVKGDGNVEIKIIHQYNFKPSLNYIPEILKNTRSIKLLTVHSVCAD